MFCVLMAAWRKILWWRVQNKWRHWHADGIRIHGNMKCPPTPSSNVRYSRNQNEAFFFLLPSYFLRVENRMKNTSKMKRILFCVIRALDVPHTILNTEYWNTGIQEYRNTGILEYYGFWYLAPWCVKYNTFVCLFVF